MSYESFAFVKFDEEITNSRILSSLNEFKTEVDGEDIILHINEYQFILKINDEVEIFLNRNNINAAAIDVVILGNNGDNRYDHYYKNLQQNLFKNTTQLAYKHLVGDYDTVSGFALYSACKILKSGRIPSSLRLNTSTPEKMKNILIYNQYLGRDHSLILLSAV